MHAELGARSYVRSGGAFTLPMSGSVLPSYGRYGTVAGGWWWMAHVITLDAERGFNIMPSTDMKNWSDSTTNGTKNMSTNRKNR